MTEQWTIDLPAPFRQRREDEALVLWRAGLTLWIWVSSERVLRPGERMKALRADISPSSFDVRTDECGGLKRLSYRLREDTTDARAPALYAFVIGSSGVVHLGVYFDQEADIVAARAAVASVREV